MPPENNRTRVPLIGIFDSGLGGLTVARRVRGLAPNVDMLYFADQRHVPYGDRDAADLRRLLTANVAYLVDEGADAIVMGCNTSCAIAARHGWPASPVPIMDLIAVAAEHVARIGARNVGVIATAATARSGAYAAAITARSPGTFVREVAAPALVPLVEAGIVAGPVARAAVAAVCRAFTEPLDAVVLACTHYPLLDAEFAAVLGDGVERIDPAVAQADHAVAWLRETFGVVSSRAGRTRYVTSGSLDAFGAGLAAVVGPLGSGDSLGRRDAAFAEALK
jgi:glutamate racemase